MLKFNELKMPFILIWKDSRIWNVRASVEYFIFLMGLLVTTFFQSSLFRIFFYPDLGDVMSPIRNPDCSVINKYCCDGSVVLKITTVLQLVCACALSSQTGLYYFHLLHLPSPPTCIFFSCQCICFLLHFILDALSSVQLFPLPFPVVSAVPVGLIPLQMSEIHFLHG